MAAIEYTRTQQVAQANGRIGKYFANAVSAFHGWNDARSTRKALKALSDRELEDIGLCRGDIALIAQQHR